MAPAERTADSGHSSQRDPPGSLGEFEAQYVQQGPVVLKHDFQWRINSEKGPGSRAERSILRVLRVPRAGCAWSRARLRRAGPRCRELVPEHTRGRSTSSRAASAATWNPRTRSSSRSAGPARASAATTSTAAHSAASWQAVAGEFIKPIGRLEGWAEDGTICDYWLGPTGTEVFLSFAKTRSSPMGA
jgi:hypothetical protein